MMWELIAANRKKSIVLFIMMALCLVALGYFIGEAAYGRGGGVGGLFIALGIWGFLAVLSRFAGSSIMLATSRAHKVERDLYPQLYNIVEEMKIASNMEAVPQIYIIEDASPNAFATGMKPENSSIAVTTGLLSRLNRDELQGVVAHEMSHIMNRDVQFMTLAGIMLGSIVLISEVFLRSLWFSSGSNRRSRVSSKGGGQIQIIIIIAAIAFAILAPLFARLLYFAISRKREYLADASGARLTRYPEGLASALEKIATSGKKLSVANKVTAPMYITNPFASGKAALSNLSSTHPPIDERIRILREMSGGAGYLNYQRAFSKIKGKPTMIIPGSGLKRYESVSIREPAVSADKTAGGKKSARDAIDLLRAVHGYAFLVCVCGLKIKIPADFDRSSFPCPRCGRENEVPLAVLAGIGGALDSAEKADGSTAARQKRKPGTQAVMEPLTYSKKSDGWESFSCSCGKLLQLSPAFKAPTIKCRHCGRITKIAAGAS